MGPATLFNNTAALTIKPDLKDEEVHCYFCCSRDQNLVSFTFDVALVPDCLKGGTACEELLQLHPGLLLVRVYAGRALQG